MKARYFTIGRLRVSIECKHLFKRIESEYSDSAGLTEKHRCEWCGQERHDLFANCLHPFATNHTHTKECL